VKLQSHAQSHISTSNVIFSISFSTHETISRTAKLLVSHRIPPDLAVYHVIITTLHVNTEFSYKSAGLSTGTGLQLHPCKYITYFRRSETSYVCHKKMAIRATNSLNTDVLPVEQSSCFELSVSAEEGRLSNMGTLTWIVSSRHNIPYRTLFPSTPLYTGMHFSGMCNNSPWPAPLSIYLCKFPGT
jgi:hypothetical protein